MPQLKSVVVKLNGKTFLTSTWCGETVDALLLRLKEMHGIHTNSQKLYVLSEDVEGTENLEMITEDSVPPIMDYFEEFNESKYPWLSEVYPYVDSIVLNLRPSIKSLMERKVVLEYIKKNLSKCLGARVFCIGSSMNNVFLPDETIEVTPFLCKGQEEKWFLRVNEGLCSDAMANGGFDSDVEVSAVAFNCKIGSISATVNGMNVTIIQNELVALYNGALLEDISHFIGKDGLIKKSLLLIKSWCSCDSPQYSHDKKGIFPGILPPRVLHIMVLHMFCIFGDAIMHPLNALVYFLFYYGNMEWQNIIITLGKPISPVDMSEVPMSSVFAKPEVVEAVERVGQRCADTTDSQMEKIRALISNYRLRYEATVAASAKAKDEDVSDAPTPDADAQGDLDRMVPVVEESSSTNLPAWGMASARPSLTTDYHNSSDSGDGSFPVPPSGFNQSHMNVADCMRPSMNLTANLTANDVEKLQQLLRCGLKRIALAIEKCQNIDPGDYGSVPLGLGSTINIAEFFVSDSFGNAQAVSKRNEKAGNYSGEAADLDELKRSKFFCESEDPESVMRHAELIMGSKITADAVANLIVHIVEQAGPHPIGEIGKLLQEATGNPNLSRVLKSQFRGLKKLIEGYPDMLRLGGDHSFNPHVYLVDSPNGDTCPRKVLSPATSLDEKSCSENTVINQSRPPTATSGLAGTTQSTHSRSASTLSAKSSSGSLIGPSPESLDAYRPGAGKAKEQLESYYYGTRLQPDADEFEPYPPHSSGSRDHYPPHDAYQHRGAHPDRDWEVHWDRGGGQASLPFLSREHLEQQSLNEHYHYSNSSSHSYRQGSSRNQYPPPHSAPAHSYQPAYRSGGTQPPSSSSSRHIHQQPSVRERDRPIEYDRNPVYHYYSSRDDPRSGGGRRPERGQQYPPSSEYMSSGGYGVPSSRHAVERSGSSNGGGGNHAYPVHREHGYPPPGEYVPRHRGHDEDESAYVPLDYGIGSTGGRGGGEGKQRFFFNSQDREVDDGASDFRRDRDEHGAGRSRPPGVDSYGGFDFLNGGSRSSDIPEFLSEAGDEMIPYDSRIINSFQREN